MCRTEIAPESISKAGDTTKPATAPADYPRLESIKKHGRADEEIALTSQSGLGVSAV